MALTLAGSTRRPTPVATCPIKETSGCLKFVDVKLKSALLTQLKKGHQVLIVILRCLLVCLSVAHNDKIICYHLNVRHSYNQFVHLALEYLWR